MRTRICLKYKKKSFTVASEGLIHISTKNNIFPSRKTDLYRVYYAELY